MEAIRTAQKCRQRMITHLVTSSQDFFELRFVIESCRMSRLKSAKFSGHNWLDAPKTRHTARPSCVGWPSNKAACLLTSPQLSLASTDECSIESNARPSGDSKPERCYPAVSEFAQLRRWKSHLHIREQCLLPERSTLR